MNNEVRPEAAVDSAAKATDPSLPIFNGVWAVLVSRRGGTHSRRML